MPSHLSTTSRQQRSIEASLHEPVLHHGNDHAPSRRSSEVSPSFRIPSLKRSNSDVGIVHPDSSVLAEKSKVDVPKVKRRGKNKTGAYIATNLTRISDSDSVSRYPLPAWSTVPAGRSVVHPKPYAFPAPRLPPSPTPPTFTSTPSSPRPSAAPEAEDGHPIPGPALHSSIHFARKSISHPIVTRSTSPLSSTPLMYAHSAQIPLPLLPRTHTPLRPDLPIARLTRRVPHRVASTRRGSIIPPSHASARPPPSMERRHSVPVFTIPNSELEALKQGGEGMYQEISRNYTPACWLFPPMPSSLGSDIPQIDPPLSTSIQSPRLISMIQESACTQCPFITPRPQPPVSLPRPPNFAIQPLENQIHPRSLSLTPHCEALPNLDPTLPNLDPTSISYVFTMPSRTGSTLTPPTMSRRQSSPAIVSTSPPLRLSHPTPPISNTTAFAISHGHGPSLPTHDIAHLVSAVPNSDQQLSYFPAAAFWDTDSYSSSMPVRSGSLPGSVPYHTPNRRRTPAVAKSISPSEIALGLDPGAFDVPVVVDLDPSKLCKPTAFAEADPFIRAFGMPFIPSSEDIYDTAPTHVPHPLAHDSLTKSASAQMQWDLDIINDLAIKPQIQPSIFVQHDYGKYGLTAPAGQSQLTALPPVLPGANQPQRYNHVHDRMAVVGNGKGLHPQARSSA